MRVKLDFVTACTDDEGSIDKFNIKAFSGVFNLGLVLGSRDSNTCRYPTDEEGLDILKYSLDGMIYKCLAGISGIGGFVAAADLDKLCHSDFENLGIAIQSMATLGMEAQDHLEGIEMDMERRQQALKAKAEELTEEVS